MQPFTTNWYLYKTYLRPCSIKLRKKDMKTPDSCASKTRHITNKVCKKTIDFEELLRGAIDEGFSLLGESAKQAIYFHLEKNSKWADGISHTELKNSLTSLIESLEQEPKYLRYK